MIASKNKIKFKDICPQYIYGGSMGWEVPLENGNIPAGYFYGKGMTGADKKEIRDYLKGLKILFNRACTNHFFDDVMGNYKGLKDKYRAILRSFTRKDIIKIGNGDDYKLTFYIDGSVGSYVG